MLMTSDLKLDPHNYILVASLQATTSLNTFFFFFLPSEEFTEAFSNNAELWDFDIIRTHEIYTQVYSPEITIPPFLPLSYD